MHWDLLSQAKMKILEFVWSQHAPSGVKLAAIKFMQRVILVQTRGVNDPRVRMFTEFYASIQLIILLLSYKTRTTLISLCAHQTTRSFPYQSWKQKA